MNPKEPELTIRAVDPEFAAVNKWIKKLREHHRRNPGLHDWTPIQTANFGEGGKDYELEIACRCGATLWVPAREVREWL